VILLSLLLACGDGEPAADPGHEGGHGGPPHGSSGPPHVEVRPEVAQALGIATAPAETASVEIEQRAPATAEWDPQDVVRVSAQPGGLVKALDLPREGEPIRAGHVVARLYSPEIAGSFEELRVASRLGDPYLSAARSRLIASGVHEKEVDLALTSTDTPSSYGVRAPRSGVVLQRLAVEGAWVSPGAALAVVGDPTDLVVDMVVTGAAPEAGTPVTLRDTTTGDAWTARVASALPTAEAAGIQVRLVPDGQIPVGRPLVAEWNVPAASEGVWVPDTALIDTGTRRVVFVEVGPGRFEPRQVRVGASAGDRVQILEGLAEGEPVVISGAFLLDSETQIGSMGHAGH
jgi:Cu(I)/Ag(I) efflux system membrane fusion protein